ncbi:MAG: hypothetical protein AB8H86_22275 [Polyangiales bacterium]
MHEIAPLKIARLQAQFDLHEASCCVVFRDARGARWKTKFTGVASIEEAIELGLSLLEEHLESAVFNEHATHGGIFVWTSTDPETLNGPFYFPPLSSP